METKYFILEELSHEKNLLTSRGICLFVRFTAALFSQQQNQTFHGLKIGYSLCNLLFVIVYTNFKILRSLKLITSMNHVAKTYPIHTFENITRNWVIFLPTTR